MQQHLFIFSHLCRRRRAFLDLVVTDYSLRCRSNQIERVSNDCRKSNTKVITPTNQNRNKKRGEPIRIPGNYLKKSRVQGAIGFGARFLNQSVSV